MLPMFLIYILFLDKRDIGWESVWVHWDADTKMQIQLQAAGLAGEKVRDPSTGCVEQVDTVGLLGLGPIGESCPGDLVVGYLFSGC